MGSKPVVGVMGAIGSGKSMAASMFGEFGFAVIDADRIVSDLYRDEKFINDKLVPLFGEKTLDENGTVNRNYISSVVFEDGGKLEELNNAVHPAVIERIEEMLVNYDKNNQVKGVVLDVPLLLEAGVDKQCDYLVFVEADIEKCIERASKRSGISQKELKKRQNSQIFLDKKKNIANYTLNNNTETFVLKRQVADVISDIFHEFNGE
jgi:dephospho-CoA kinase